MRQLTKNYAPSVKANNDDVYPIMIETDIDDDHPLSDCTRNNLVKVNLGFPNSYDPDWMPAPYTPAQLTDSLKAHQEAIAGVLAKVQGRNTYPRAMREICTSNIVVTLKLPLMTPPIIKPCSLK